MLVFPNCKINLGLNITAKRSDGFHTIETVFYPINWCDALEVIENQDGYEPFVLEESGILTNSKKEDNLVYKAWKLVAETSLLPPIKVQLLKNLPMGAGLGGGSSDAAFLIKLLNSKFGLDLSITQMEKMASKIGSDCSFFINNQPVLAKGKGDEFSEIKINLSNYYILIVFPNINSNTKEAYADITPASPKNDLKAIIENKPVSEWKDRLINDFERTVFITYPQIKELKDNLYASGALYASMSGSGSSVFGIFDKKPGLNFDTAFKFYLQTPAQKTL